MNSIKAKKQSWRTLKSLLFLLEFKLKNTDFFSTHKPAVMVFFPGCSLAGADPTLTKKTYDLLKESDPAMGIWFDCCGKPLDKFGHPDDARRAEEQLYQNLHRAGVKEVITACGNCHGQLAYLEVSGIKVNSLYKHIADQKVVSPQNTVLKEIQTDDSDCKEVALLYPKEWIIHHPCSSRENHSLEGDFFKFALKLKLPLVKQDQHPLSCCLSRSEGAKKKRERMVGKEVLTYCGHCTTSFQSDFPVRHVLQVLFGSDCVWRPKDKVSQFAAYRKMKKMFEHN